MLYNPEEVLIERYPFVVLNRNLNGNTYSPSSKIRIALKFDDPQDLPHTSFNHPPKSYAVKLIWKYSLSDLQSNNLTRGIGIHKYLSSIFDGVVRLVEVIEDERCFYLIMDALDGDLVTVLEHKRTALLEEEAREIFKQTIHIVNFLHTNDIVHRDLKLDNLMISWDSPTKKNKVEKVRLGDFDFADYEKDGSLRSIACGSPPYAAPELTDINPIYNGKKTDVWSIGVLLYVLVCGKFPWYDPDMMILFQKIKKEPLTLPSHLSSELKDLLSKLLDKDPYHRITIPNIINHSWFTTL
jgi:serine/threonine protein kinase